jgi:uncharacterized protein (TIGR00297 family)
VTRQELGWQSKAILLGVLPFVGTAVVLACDEWVHRALPVLIWTLGLSALLGLVTLKLRAVTPWAAAAGAVITASLTFSTSISPYEPWHTALMPTLAVSFLAFAATRVGHRQKERLGTTEGRNGRTASQITANLGMAALGMTWPVQQRLVDSGFARGTLGSLPVLALGLAALSEAAADTVSSEIGQVLGGRPRMITTLRAVEPGRDGAITAAGTMAGVIAAAAVAAIGAWALRGDWSLFKVSCAGGVFGLFFDSLLGATFEEHGWLNNDAVNFLSTISASAFALAMLAISPHSAVG